MGRVEEELTQNHKTAFFIKVSRILKKLIFRILQWGGGKFFLGRERKMQKHGKYGHSKKTKDDSIRR